MGTAIKTVYVLCGLPFAGKTTHAQEIMKDRASRGERTLLIERDAFLESINHESETQTRLREEARLVKKPLSILAPTHEANALNDVLSCEYCVRVKRAIRETSATSIIVDGTHLQPISRAFFDPSVDVRYVAIVFPLEPHRSIERWQKASRVGIRRTITAELIQRMATIFQYPTLQEGFDEIHKRTNAMA